MTEDFPKLLKDIVPQIYISSTAEKQRLRDSFKSSQRSKKIFFKET